MNKFDYQFIIIGGGAAGFAAAIKADSLKIKTLMISGGKVPLGGTCINVGCMPSKRLLTAAEAYWNAKNSKFDGVKSAAPELSFEEVIKSKDALINKLQSKAYAGTLKFLVYVTLKEGDPEGVAPRPYGAGAKFIDEHTIEVNGEKITGEKFLISTGSSTFIPPISGLINVDYLTNIEALSLKELPKSMVILGGGPLGLEFSQIYNRFGTKVTVLQSADRIADREEPELSNFLQKKLEEEGITIHTSAQTKSVSRHDGLIEVQADVRGKEVIIKAEKILVATGVRANTQPLNLESIGVGIGKKGGVVTNEFLQTDLPHVFAAGDVVDQYGDEINPKLETTAGREGFVAASNLLENKGLKMDFRSTPHAIFTDPPLVSVGLTDAQVVKQSGLTCSCRTLSLELVPKAHILEAADGLIKMAIDAKTEEVVGIHMAGARAEEVISMASFIIKNRMKLDDIIENTFIFPTMAESIKWVAQSFRKDVSKLSCCTE
ncbi:MAG: mercury(II) reductase [Candidatus Sungiibacteriota bacterium]|uniref:Mercuric reductase n=1 Tax=Candidatus Sungiibacteriota bacterium TaxID=2750080 RepID=A0A7T5RJ94_9BACT|nr:MAG: mercury(II) reductase [Candidatus Sungbacteria bacterium]